MSNHLAVCFWSLTEAMFSSWSISEKNKSIWTSDLSTWEVGAGGAEVQGQGSVHSEFEAILDYVKPGL